jgi:hypothetical protein
LRYSDLAQPFRMALPSFAQRALWTRRLDQLDDYLKEQER